MQDGGEGESARDVLQPVSDLEVAAAWSAEYQMTAAGFWTNIQLYLGIAAAVLAGVSSVSALRDRTLLAGIAAAVAAALSAVLASLRPNERAQGHEKAGKAYNQVRFNLQKLRAEGLNGSAADHARKLDEIQTEWLAASTTSPWVPRRLYRKARMLAAEGTPYFTDAPLPLPPAPAPPSTRLLNRLLPGRRRRHVARER